MLPFVLPPTVLGLVLLLVFAPIQIAFSFWGILLGSIILNFPIAVQAFAEGFRNVHGDYSDASFSFGAGKVRTFFLVILPLSWPALLSGFTLSFAHAFGEFGVAMMLGGNLSGETRTISISIYDSVQSLKMGEAQQTAIIQMLFCLILLAGLSFFKQRTRVWVRSK